LSIDDWDSNWTETQKRDYIAATIKVQAHKGTPWAIKRILTSLGHQVDMKEWFDYEGGQPKRFRLHLQLTDETLDESDWEGLLNLMIRRVTLWKNTRSQLDKLIVYQTVTGSLKTASVCIGEEITRVLPFVHLHIESISISKSVSATFIGETATLFPKTA
jgi:P2-related tail formation protein